MALRSDAILGVVLAGGQGARMGGEDKGWVDYRGRPLVEIAIERLRPQVGSLALCANRNLARYRALGLPVIVDDPTLQLESYAGPLAGICSALRHAAAAGLDWVAIVPCDAPHLPRDLVARLAAALAGHAATPAAAAYATHAGRAEPCFALLAARLAPALADALRLGERRVDRFLAATSARAVAFDTPGDARGFVNLNSMTELRRDEQR